MLSNPFLSETIIEFLKGFVACPSSNSIKVSCIESIHSCIDIASIISCLLTINTFIELEIVTH